MEDVEMTATRALTCALAFAAFAQVDLAETAPKTWALDAIEGPLAAKLHCTFQGLSEFRECRTGNLVNVWLRLDSSGQAIKAVEIVFVPPNSKSYSTKQKTASQGYVLQALQLFFPSYLPSSASIAGTFKHVAERGQQEKIRIKQQAIYVVRYHPVDSEERYLVVGFPIPPSVSSGLVDNGNSN